MRADREAAEPTYTVTMYLLEGTELHARDVLNSAGCELTLAEARDFARDYNVRLSLHAPSGVRRFDVEPNGDYAAHWYTKATTICASISDGSSSNGGGEETFAAADYDSAVELAKEWAREGDYTSSTEAHVDVVVNIRREPDGDICETVTVSAPAYRPE